MKLLPFILLLLTSCSTICTSNQPFIDCADLDPCYNDPSCSSDEEYDKYMKEVLEAERGWTENPLTKEL